MLSIACATSLAKTRCLSHMPGTQLKAASTEGTNRSSILNMVMPLSMRILWKRIAESIERWLQEM